MSLSYIQTATAAATNALIIYAADHHHEVASALLDHVAALVKATAADLGGATNQVDALSILAHSLGQLRVAEAEHDRMTYLDGEPASTANTVQSETAISREADGYAEFCRLLDAGLV